MVDPNPPTCALADHAESIRAALAATRYGFCLVVNDQRIVLGRVRKSTLCDADPSATAEAIMESGPSTVRPNQSAETLRQRLASGSLATAIVTTPTGALLGVFHRHDVERELRAGVGS